MGKKTIWECDACKIHSVAEMGGGPPNDWAQIIIVSPADSSKSFSVCKVCKMLVADALQAKEELCRDLIGFDK